MDRKPCCPLGSVAGRSRQVLYGAAREGGAHGSDVSSAPRYRGGLLGAEPGPNFRGSADWDLVAVCDPRRGAGTQGDRRRARPSRWRRRWSAARPGRHRRGRDRDTRRAPTRRSPWPRSRRASTSLVEKPLAPTPAPRRRWSTRRRRAGPGADGRPHLLLHAGGAVHPRADRARASSATSCTSTRSGSTSGWCSRDVDVFWDLAPHDLSILDFILPGGLAPAAVVGDRGRPARRRQGLRRLPDACRSRGGDRARPRQLAVARPRSARWSSAAAAAPWSGTTSTRSSGSRSTTAASTSHPEQRDADSAATRRGVLPPRRHHVAGAAGARGAGAMVDRVRRRHPRAARAAHGRRGRPAGAVRARGRLREPGRARRRRSRALGRTATIGMDGSSS